MAEGGSLRPPSNFLASCSTQNPSDTSRSWTSWLEQFDFYMTATEKDAKDEGIQVATLLTILGAQGQELFRTFELSETDRKKIKPVKDAFKRYFAPKVKEEFERYRFYSRVQQAEESFDRFLSSLRTLIATCNFHAEEKDKALRDRIVFGIRTEAVREELFNISTELTLDKCVEVCQRHEATKQYMHDFKIANEDPVSKVHAINQRSMTGFTQRRESQQRSSDQPSQRFVTSCKYCGGSHLPRKCPAYDKTCKTCNKKGHFQKVCRSTTQQERSMPANARVWEVTTDGEDITHAINGQSRNKHKEWYVEVDCQGNKIDLKVDTGATCNVMPVSVFRRLTLSNVRAEKHNQALTAFGGHMLRVVGKVTLMLERRNVFSVHDFVLVDQGETTLLGLPSCIRMGLVETACAMTNSTVVSDFPEVFEGLGKLPSMHALRLKEGSKPVVQGPRRVPFRLREKLKDTLDTMESKGTIAKVKMPTDWVHPIVNVLKPDGSLRVCLDPTELNKCIRREHFALPTVTEIFSKLSKSRVFSSLDATQGFLQLELDDDSSFLTTFATPFGRYRFRRLPFGISSAPEVFHRTISETFADIEGVETFVDDLLIHAPTKAEHDAILRKVLARCKTVNLKLNLSKCRFEQSELKYLGHIIGQGIIKPDPAKIRAIIDMPVPKCAEDLRRLLGMATYLSKFCHNLAEVTAPLRDLTKKGTPWLWSAEHKNALDMLKSLLTSNQLLKMFDPSEPVTLSVDSSQSGMGATIMQNGQPVEFASCSLTSAQKSYAQIEKEFLAIQYGLTRFHQYIYGQKITVETDHLPLLGIKRKGLNDITPRLQRMRLRTQLYDFDLIHKPGTAMHIADTLSRAYINEHCPNSVEFNSRDYDQIHAVTTGILPDKSFRDRFAKTTVNDPTMGVIKTHIVNGWPANRRSCSDPAKPYWNVRQELSVHDDIVLKGNQLVVPVALRATILQDIHKGHLGVSKCIERAKNSVYWPGYTSAITDLVESCETCKENARANASVQLEPYDIPEYPMQALSMDIFQLNGVDYLVTVDRYSKWPTCCKLKSSTSGEIIKLLSQQFLDFGQPETVVSDNASYFTSHEFKSFMHVCDIRHITSSPHFSRSNGLAERMNQTVKTCLTKAQQSGQSLSDVIRTLRSTPLGEGLPAPSVLLQGRDLRSTLNILPQQLKTQHIDNDKVVELFRKRQAQSQFSSSSNIVAKNFVQGMGVWVKMGHRNWVSGKVVKHGDTPHSYYVELTDGRTFRRNQAFLKVRKTAIVSARPSCQLPEHPSEQRTFPPITEPLPVPSAPDTQSSASARGLGEHAGLGGLTTVTRGGRVSRPPVRFGQNIFDKK